MQKIDTLLKKIEENPIIFIGEKSLTKLVFYLYGYMAALREHTNENITFYEDFEPWINEKFEIFTTQHWSKKILFFSHTEEEAFNLFFKLFKEFKKMN